MTELAWCRKMTRLYNRTTWTGLALAALALVIAVVTEGSPGDNIASAILWIGLMLTIWGTAHPGPR